MRHRVFLYFVILFFFVSLIGGSVLSTYTQFVAEGPLEERTEILIENGQLNIEDMHRQTEFVSFYSF